MSRALCALLAAALLVAGCGSSGGSGQAAATRTPTPAATPTPSKPRVQVPRHLPKHLLITDLRKGTGRVARSGDKVTVNYVGVSALNGRQFDSSWDRGQAFSFQLGTGAVIPGWDQGVAGMRVGGRRRLVIPPDLAYGAQGQGPIGPNETLVFVIDLLKVA